MQRRFVLERDSENTDKYVIRDLHKGWQVAIGHVDKEYVPYFDEMFAAYDKEKAHLTHSAAKCIIVE